MNTFGTILSLGFLSWSLLELRMRSDLRGRRIGAAFSVAAWATMGTVAYDQSRQCMIILEKQTALHEIHHAQVVIPEERMVSQGR